MTVNALAPTAVPLTSHVPFPFFFARKGSATATAGEYVITILTPFGRN